MTSTIVRDVTVKDAPALLEIYSWYVKNTAITYEYDIPSLEEFESRISKTLEKFPYICAEADGKILGYAYAGSFHPRAAYQWCAELSIYVDRNKHKAGLGRLLYDELESRLKEKGFLNLYACIAVPTCSDDEYLNHNSQNFHQHMGFATVGTFKDCAKKFGRWYSMVWMEKIIGEHK